jgi:fructokinase
VNSKKQIVGLGEVLWDLFSDGPRFGGAPANFACSAAGVGRDSVHACMISAVGHDELGRKALRELQQRHVDVNQVERTNRPTGQVLVQLNSTGQASYEFAADSAWDNLTWSENLKQTATSCDAVCFGTLGQRSPKSQQTIQQFLAATPAGCLRILDINLRPPFWSEEIILSSLPLANVLKLNDEELPVVASILSLAGTEKELLQQLISRFPLRLLALTRGSRGSLLLSASGQLSELDGVPTQVTDTVGAGDAFTAALAVGLLAGLPLPQIHSAASELAAFVCTQPGGTPEIPPRFAIPSF